MRAKLRLVLYCCFFAFLRETQKVVWNRKETNFTTLQFSRRDSILKLWAVAQGNLNPASKQSLSPSARLIQFELRSQRTEAGFISHQTRVTKTSESICRHAMRWCSLISDPGMPVSGGTHTGSRVGTENVSFPSHTCEQLHWKCVSFVFSGVYDKGFCSHRSLLAGHFAVCPHHVCSVMDLRMHTEAMFQCLMRRTLT